MKSDREIDGLVRAVLEELRARSEELAPYGNFMDEDDGTRACAQDHFEAMIDALLGDG